MISRFLLLLLACGMAQPLLSQRIDSRLDLGRRQPKPTFFEHSPADGGLITFGPMSVATTRFLGIVKYDAALKEEWKKEVIEQNGRKHVDLVSVIGEYIMVFVSEFFPGEGVIKTTYSSFDLQGNPVVEEAIISVVPNQKEQKVELQYVYSPNKRRLLAYKNLANRRESETVVYFLFDDEGEIVQNGEFDLKYPDNRFTISNIRVSNNGNIFVLGKFTRTVPVVNPDDFEHIIYRYDLQQREGNEIKIDIGGRFISDLAFRLDRDENMYIAGFFSNRGVDMQAGTLLQKITPNGQVEVQALSEFDASFMSNYLSAGQIDRGRELRNFFIDPEDGIVLRSDGGVLLIAEKFYVTYQSYRDMYGTWVDRPIYHFEDVIFTSVSSDGRIEWHSIVDKRQMSESPEPLSFFGAIGAAGSYVFYQYKPQRGPINVYVNQVGISGEVSERRPLFDDYRYTDAFFPRQSIQINAREALLVCLTNQGKGLSVIKVNLDE